MSRIELQDVSKKIKGVYILQNITADFDSKKIYGLIGENGSGKSMLLRLIAGLIIPEKGEVLYDGKPRLKSRISVGLAIDDISFYPDMTGFQNLMSLAEIKKEVGSAEVRDSLIRVGLENASDEKFRKYSLGMKQRLVIAQAIMESPSFLLFDEPTNALDKEGIELIYEIVKEEKKKGTGVIISSHRDDDFLNEYSDQIMRMDNGMLNAD